MNLEDIKKMTSEIEVWLRMRNHPVAIKMMKDKQEIPEGAVIPSRDLGHKLALCQAISLAEDGNEMRRQ